LPLELGDGGGNPGLNLAFALVGRHVSPLTQRIVRYLL
jgi:hypothetical protein